MKKKITIKVKRPKRRVPIAPPGKAHKRKVDYDRKRESKIPKDQ